MPQSFRFAALLRFCANACGIIYCGFALGYTGSIGYTTVYERIYRQWGQHAVHRAKFRNVPNPVPDWNIHKLAAVFQSLQKRNRYPQPYLHSGSCGNHFYAGGDCFAQRRRCAASDDVRACRNRCSSGWCRRVYERHAHRIKKSRGFYLGFFSNMAKRRPPMIFLVGGYSKRTQTCGGFRRRQTSPSCPAGCGKALRTGRPASKARRRCPAPQPPHLRAR